MLPRIAPVPTDPIETHGDVSSRRPPADLPDTMRDNAIKVGIIAVPSDAAQSVADQMVAAGIRGLLKFRTGLAPG